MGRFNLIKRRNVVDALLAENLACGHLSSHLTQRKTRNGGIQIRRQCQICGQSLSSAIAHDAALKEADGLDLAAFPVFDETLEATRRQSVIDEHKAMLEDIEIEFDRHKAAYYKSAKWKELRQLVMERAGGVCEGCGRHPAEEVHHKTYNHFEDEFLFELLALCTACHLRVHKEDTD